MNCKYIDIAKNLEFWDESIKIYQDSFPEWEREDEENILLNIKSGIYTMHSYLCDNEIVGFYILDTNKELNYTLFSFLAIKEDKRGKGIGSKLCLDAVEYFQTKLSTDWLLIEAEDRQAKLYEKLGFTRLQLDYRVPKFNSTQSVHMNLMQVENTHILDTNSLKNIIKDIFHRGYSLELDDARIQEQLQKVNI